MRVMPVVRESQLVVPGCSRGLLERDNRADAVCGGESVAASRWRRVVGGDSNIWIWIGTHGKDDRRVGINEKQDGAFRTNGMMSTCEGTGDFAFEFIDAGNPL
jgi:hypothetical protein